MLDDRRRLRALFDAHGQQVYRRALRLLGNPADAEEAMQEVFVRAARHIEALRSGEVVRWLYRTTTHYCLNLMRDRSRRRELLAEHGPTVRPATGDPDALLTLRALLARADEREARCVTYLYIDQLSQQETAEMMGISVRSVGYLLASFREWASRQVDLGSGDGRR